MMKKNPFLKFILITVSSCIAIIFSSASKRNAPQNSDKGGVFVQLTNGDISCVPGPGNKCLASDCNAPNISTGCDDPLNDHDTTVNDK